jgi:hypothetical protein
MAEVLFQVEKIVDGPNDKSQFLIKWEGYPKDQNTWEPLENLPVDMVDEYLGTLPGRPKYTGTFEKKPAKVSKQERSKRQKIPGVDIAKVVDDSKKNFTGKAKATDRDKSDSEEHDADGVGEDEDEDESIPGPPVCKLKHYEKGRGEWDRALKDYKFPAQECQKYR